ncbi:AAA family ATPase [Mesorhizobium sp.]|uniref:AAA family ATPase n=1 Tax=Mesorhizobium sp. TaxID=1871066 RepID=UPI0011F55D4E|nr:AAA family ATPase [Mesorhizobium sp.]TIT02462.1 MAG: ATP-binding protein [Mesorhizobium sp.]
MTYWPIRCDAELPPVLFPPEHLRQTLFEFLPLRFGCSATTIRQGLKTHLKRTVPQSWRSTMTGDQLARDRAMAATLGNCAAARSRTADIVFVSEMDDRRYGRGSSQVRTRRVRDSFAQLIWSGYVRDPSLTELVDWCVGISVKRPEISDGIFLTAHTLRNARQAGPFPVTGPKLARAITLFASLLPEAEGLDLLETALELGCSELAELGLGSRNEEEPVGPMQQAAPEQVEAPTELPINQPSRPRLERPSEPVIPRIAPSSDLQRQAVELGAIASRSMRSSSHASKMVGFDPTVLIAAPDEQWADIVAAVDAARADRSALVETTSAVQDKLCSLRAAIEAAVGVKVAPNLAVDAEQDLAGQLRTHEGLVLALEELKPSTSCLAKWRERATLPADRGSLDDLLGLAASEAAEREARSRFLVHVKDWAPSRSTADLAAFLHDSSAEELEIIVTDMTDDTWIVGGALLLRAAVDAARGTVPEGLLNIILSQHETGRRRSLLRFVDPSSSAFDEHPDIRRLVAAERLRDALIFGPLAQISDPGAGLSDPELVGRTVSKITELVTAALDTVGSGPELLRLVQGPDQDSHGAEAALTSFIAAPAGLKGNFRRLRELARESLLLPILIDGRPDARKARTLAAALASREAAVAEVLTEFHADRPIDRLEPRHVEQLERYLDQAALLISDFASELDHRLDLRSRAVRDALQSARQQLRGDGSIGSVEWLEGQLAHLLAGDGLQHRHATLLGSPEPLNTRTWSSSDDGWLADHLDLPERYGRQRPSTMDVAASVVKWRSVGRLPGPHDIVEELIAKREFEAALNVSERSGDAEASALVREAVAPTVQALQARRTQLNTQDGAGSTFLSEEDAAVDACLARLDLDGAADHLDLIELALAEAAAKPQNESGSLQQERLLRLLDLAGVSVGGRHLPSADLQSLWDNTFAARAHEWHHLSVVDAAFAGSNTYLTELEMDLTAFRAGIEEADRWLPKEIASNFADLVQDSAVKLGSWAKSAHMLVVEERSALASLTRWFLDFVVERAQSLNQIDDPDAIETGLQRLLEVADCILSSDRAGLCLAQVEYIGEIVVSPLGRVGESDQIESAPRSATPADDEGNVGGGAPVSLADPSTEVALPPDVRDAIRRDDWNYAAEACRTAAASAGTSTAEKLISRARAFAALADLSARPAAEVADALPAAAAWLSSVTEEEAGVGESRWAELAYRLLTGAVAADSSSDMARAPAQGGSWSELPISPFGRMIAGELPSRTSRVFNALVTGANGSIVAERVWDAATSIREPQAFRTPLLVFLHEHGAQEAVLRLAHRYDNAIEARLAQLFDLRAVASNRPDLLPVAEALAGQIASDAKPGPFRTFLRNLPTAARAVKPALRVSLDDDLRLRERGRGTDSIDLPVVVTPEGLVPALLEVQLFADDDVTFADLSRRRELSASPIYFAADFTLPLRFGPSWFEAKQAGRREGVRLRFAARTLTGDLIHEDVVCSVRALDRSRQTGRTLDTETLLELYPGVSNTPAIDGAFVGRIDELERLRQALVSARRPSPVLLTGMRRIGKTSLLYKFHRQHAQPGAQSAITFYVSLAERRVELAAPDQSVSATVFKAISHGLVRQNLTTADQNYALSARIRESFGNDWKQARKAIQDCYDEQSLSDSLIALSDRVREWTGMSEVRLLLLMDEAEALVAAYQVGGRKRLELEQLLQSLREVSQTTGLVGILLSGSNHINVFAREYKNAFFGSSQAIALEGFKDFDAASKIVAPNGVMPYIQFDRAAVEYARELCSGMPQFLWQVGATTSFQVRTGPAMRLDIRGAVATLVRGNADLPFKPYEILEPIDNMLGLEAPRERDLLWMLLYRVAQASSLAAPEAAIPFVIDQALLSLDGNLSWKQRLRSLVDLKVLRMDSPSAVRFEIPLFAEGFRAPRYWQEFNLRQQQVAG